MGKRFERIARARRSLLCAGGLVVALAGAGCERGCLTSWWMSRELGPGGALLVDGGGPFDLTGTDCSDGLARCVGGTVFVSRRAHVPASCGKGAPETASASCACPWESEAVCALGCAADGVEVAVPKDEAERHLCKAVQAVLEPVAARDTVAPELCTDIALSCVGGVVRNCDGAGKPPRVLGVCRYGCAVRVSVDPGERPIADGAATILCGHPPAGPSKASDASP